MTREITAALERRAVSGIDNSALARSLYSSDASIFRIAPQVVVAPRHIDEIAAVLDACRELSVPLTMRGAGTSIAGNAIGAGVVVDVSRHLDRIIEIDAEARTATVEPGVVQSSLQAAAARVGLRFGPDPSTHNRATLGGMIGNNACGSRALGYGRTSDNVLGLTVLTGTGERLSIGADTTLPKASPVVEHLQGIVSSSLATVRTEFGTFGRQVSGYSLEHLLPERGFDIARALVGTEGTLALTLGATVRLVVDQPVRLLLVLGYDSMAEAADDVPAILPHRPVACEGLDSRIVDVVRERRGADAVPRLPRGRGWLMVELTGESEEEVRQRAHDTVTACGAIDALIVGDAAESAALWRIREDGAGLAARTPEGKPAHAGWEDTAVPPERLGVYLREFESLLDSYGFSGVPYGHFGDGCVHIRIDFPLDEPGGTAVYRSFLLEAAKLVASHGGSMSGEHGDGRARSELLPIMYSDDAIRLFGAVKHAFDPLDILNPGVIVRPAPLDANVRVAQSSRITRLEMPTLGFAYSQDRGDLSMAVHRCTGVGKCRASTGITSGGGVMCPSFLATRDEKDSTRGRARVLQDVVSGALGPQGWRSDAVRDALDLCLSCKGCASDCPTGVDMATYKAEALHQRYRRRIRPRSHYSLGWLPRWARLVSLSPLFARAANGVLGANVLQPILAKAAGIDHRRRIPAFATTTFRSWFRKRSGTADNATAAEVVLFVDTFTNAFTPEVGSAAVSVLEAAGYRVSIVPRTVCCGLTWISTGQLDGARRQVMATVQALHPFVDRGALVVGLEPSCTAVLRSEAVELLTGADRQMAESVSAATRTLGELLSQTEGWVPPDLSGVSGAAQPHCHHHAVMGWQTDADILAAGGAQIDRLGGCCGLAGNFGVEEGHYDVSVKVAEQQLLPAIRSARPGDVLLSDGFSCRTQIESLTDARGEHLAQLLARHLPSSVTD